MPLFAPVAPIHIYEEMLSTQDPSIIGDYFLLLAHDVLDKPEAYRRVFTDPLMREATVIMDNSVIELGSSVSAKVLQEAADIVNANVVAIPDVLEDGVGTLKACAEFLSKWNPGHPAELMFIPQGKDLEEWCRCLDAVSNLAWIGIPRNTVPRITHTRQLLVLWAKHLHPEANIHLLGFSGSVQDDIDTCNAFPYDIEGIDSAVPVRCVGGFAKRVTDHTIDYIGPRGDWWETAKWSREVADNIIAMRRFIDEVQ